jgi:hypothetical protein
MLRQLESLETGEPYDQVSMISDSDISSMRRNISNWIQSAPSTVDTINLDDDIANQSNIVDRLGTLNLPMPNTKFGAVRSASLIKSQVLRLCLTELNVMAYLQLAGGRNQNTNSSKQTARDLVDFLNEGNEIPLVQGEDLTSLEEI